MGFTVKSKNAVAPKGGAPLTVLEFSLTNEVRESLRLALEPYVEGRVTADTPSLKTIIEAHIPREVLDELRKMNMEGEPPSNVYVMKNMPEFPAEDIASGKYSDYFLRHRTYAYFIGEGIADAVGLIRNDKFLLTRKSGDIEIDGLTPHKHPDDITGLSILHIADAAKPITGFTDMASLIEDPLLTDDLTVTVFAQGKPRNRGTAPISQFQTKWPKWKDAEEVALSFGGDQARLDALLERHSQKIIPSQGDLILWSNRGNVYHEAFPAKDTPYSPETITRIAFGHKFQRDYRILA